MKEVLERLSRGELPGPGELENVLGGTDEDVIKSLGGKANAQDSLLEALKVRIQKSKEAAA